MVSSYEIEESWKIVVDKVISCLSDESPNDMVLATYLGKPVANKYRVGLAVFTNICYIHNAYV